MIKFTHTADIHFGMENYGRMDPATGIHTRLLDFDRALNFCIDRSISENIDFFLFSGDAYKTANPSPTQQRLLLKSFLRLYQAKIPVVIVVGNHDHPLSFGKANSLDIFGELPIDGFYVISKPTALTLETRQGPINIVGIPWPTRNTIALNKTHLHKSALEITAYISQAVTNIIHHYAAQLDPHIPAVLAGHLTVSNGIFSGSEKRAVYGTDPIFLPSALAIPPFDYVALGHLHRYQNLNPDGYPAVVYSGSPERIDFGERKEEKGFCLVTIEKKGSTHHEFIKTPIRPFIQVEVHLTTDRDQTEQILQALAQHTLRNSILKIIYHIPPGYKDNVRLYDIQRACLEVMHLVGIIPIRKITQREKRAQLKVTMDLPTLLTAYFEQKKELLDKKDALIQKTLDLLHECENEEIEESML